MSYRFSTVCWSLELTVLNVEIIREMSARFTDSQSKVKALVDQISAGIMRGELAVGDDLPSINVMANARGVSRDTVFKAYRELKERGVIDATPAKGYFVKGEVNNVLLLLDTFSPFKDVLYQEFITALPEGKYKVDVMFHQYNERLFDTLLRDSIGRYNYYVVMNFSNTQFSPQLELIPRNRLLLMDFGNFGREEYSYVCQNFDTAFYDVLEQAIRRFQLYEKLILIFPDNAPHPHSSPLFFKKFCQDKGLVGEVLNRRIRPENIEKGIAYLTVEQKDMVNVLRGIKQKSLTLGTDVGLLAYNDIPLHEVIEGGITSVSVDFGKMGRLAARFVGVGEEVRVVLPTKLVLRNSL